MNNIGDNGAKYLGEGLCDNKVRRMASSFSELYIDSQFFIQGLITLLLAWIRIGDEGVRYLSNALSNNKVNKNNCSDLLYITVSYHFT
jgi:hypothetical protein